MTLFARWRRPERFESWLPWLLPIDDDEEILMTAVGGLLRVVRIDPPDFETASPEMLVAHVDRIAAALARYGNGWSFWMDQWRTRSQRYLEPCDFGGNLAAQMIEASRRSYFEGLDRPVFLNTAFIAIHYQPQSRDAMVAWLMGREASEDRANIAFFKEHSRDFLEEINHSMRGVHRLAGDELSSYLSATVTYEPKLTRFPGGMIRQGLGTRQWTTQPHLQIDDRHLVTVEIRNYGSPSPLTLEALHQLPFELRWCVALHGLDADARLREGLRRAVHPGDPAQPSCRGHQSRGRSRAERARRDARRPH
jgi:hypothetical protein